MHYRGCVGDRTEGTPVTGIDARVEIIDDLGSRKQTKQGKVIDFDKLIILNYVIARPIVVGDEIQVVSIDGVAVSYNYEEIQKVDVITGFGLKRLEIYL